MDDLSPISAGDAHDELVLLRTLGANLLLTGSASATRNVIDANLLGLRGPLTAWAPGARLVLPPVEAAGTLILHEVGSLPHDDQVRLLAWLEEAIGRTRVVCTTSASLMSRLEAGTFNPTLYYRLNTVSVNVTASPTASVRLLF